MGWLAFMGAVIDSALWPTTFVVCALVFTISIKKPLTLLAQALLERQKAQSQQAQTEHERWTEERRLLEQTFEARTAAEVAQQNKTAAEAELATRVAAETAEVAVEYRRRVIAAEAGAEIRDAPKTAAARKAAEIKRSLLERLIVEYDKYVAHADTQGNNTNPLGSWLAQIPERFLK